MVIQKIVRDDGLSVGIFSHVGRVGVKDVIGDLKIRIKNKRIQYVNKRYINIYDRNEYGKLY